jgi:hypothetical protein
MFLVMDLCKPSEDVDEQTCKPGEDQAKRAYIRVFPESNSEMGDALWIHNCFEREATVELIQSSFPHIVVILKEKARKP